MPTENAYKSTVHKILRNRIYTGDFEWDGQLYKGTHKPIVSCELWQIVQDVLDNRSGNRPKKRKHDFAFSGLIRCGHTGTYLVGEIKKGRYVCYRALGAKGVPYVKQEVLEDKFCQVLKGLHFDDDVLEWVVQALKESQADTRQFQEETVSRLQTEYKRLEGRLQAMYIDKLDEKITSAFYEEKAAEWRKEQNDILDRIRQIQDAGQSYMDEGVQLLELAQNAHYLFVKQSPAEKRRLLNFMVSNCIWKDGELAVELKQPFGMLAEQNKLVSEEKGVLGQNVAVFEKWLPGPDSNQRPSD
ncbi:MAG: recombinase family protein [Alphaproteobacteria bacterium]|nr:recombinase family protein [Alphaproteobacteria bacterium]